MRNQLFAGAVVLSVSLAGPLASQTVMAACKTIETSHNGTDMFHETGASGAAVNKLLIKVDQLKLEHGEKKVRMGRVSTKCGPWFTKYMLPHRQCVAKARVCY